MKIGSDPEFPLTYGGEFRSAIGVLPSKKKNFRQNGCAFYYDNVLAECAVKPGAGKDEFIDNLQECLTIFARLVHPYRLELLAALDYPESELRHRQARKAGCKEEQCGYSLDVVLPPKHVIKRTAFRTAGGHVHLGAEDGLLQDAWEKIHLVRMLDLFLGVPLLFIDKDKTSKDRKKIYGKAGSHRYPKHGLEYRPPGNYWLGSPKLAAMVHDLCAFTLDFVEQKRYQKFWTVDTELLYGDDPSQAYHCFGYDVGALRNALDGCDKKAGKKFMTFIEQWLPERLMQEINTAIDLPTVDFYKEWKIL